MISLIHKIRKGPEHHKRRWVVAVTLSCMVVIVGMWALMLRYELDTPDKTAEADTTSEKHNSPFEAVKVMFQNAKQAARVLDGVESYKAQDEKEEKLVPLEVVPSDTTQTKEDTEL